MIEPAFVRSPFDQNSLEPDAQLPVYDQARAGVHAMLREVLPTADTPEDVAKTVVIAAMAARPLRRYASGKTARQISLLRRFAPAAMFDKVLRKNFRLPA